MKGGYEILLRWTRSPDRSWLLPNFEVQGDPLPRPVYRDYSHLKIRIRNDVRKKTVLCIENVTHIQSRPNKAYTQMYHGGERYTIPGRVLHPLRDLELVGSHFERRNQTSQ